MASTSQRREDVIGSTAFGQYTVVRKIGDGGMGSVYEATHTALGKQVALKLLLPEMATNPEFAARFVREGRAAARIRHPHVVDVYDVGSSTAGTYLVMELLEGADLSSLLSTRGRLSVHETLALLLPVFSAVVTAHRAGVIHRDLKPANVFLASDPTGRIMPKVVDFGISKIVEEAGGLDLTQSAAVLGTPYYMAPEQVQAVKNTDARSDQYALGVILFECLTGERPFVADGLFELLVAIGSGQAPSVSSVANAVPKGLSDAIERAMSRAPAERFASVQEFGRAVLPFADDLTRALWSAEFGDVAVSDDAGKAPTRDTSRDVTLIAPAHSAGGTSQPSESGASRRRAVYFAAVSLAALGVGFAAFVFSKGHPAAEPIAVDSGSNSATISTASVSVPIEDSPASSIDSAGVHSASSTTSLPPVRSAERVSTRKPPTPSKTTSTTTPRRDSGDSTSGIRGANSAWIIR